jgi:hypothetical protein
MRVRTETVIENRTISVELDDTDGLHEFGGKGWATWPTVKQFKVLSARADMLAVYYLGQSHLIDTETAQKRMGELMEQIKTAVG